MATSILAKRPDDDGESALKAFLAPLAAPAALRLRTLAHSWSAAGGTLQPGRLTVRLLAGPPGTAYTAATLHAAPARVELSHVLLAQHGLQPEAWTAWCDELAELHAHGLSAAAKYPAITLAGLSDATAARLALGLRDLCHLVHARSDRAS